jgi:Flp pilus assembly protein TadD/SAM-dependent methyltransferase/glycosyltransferase involved in cell wall biosynthesis
MNFTGERYVTSLNSAQISYEHWHRYFFSTPLVKDRTVLDIACGEGYGSHLLSHRAKSVLGVDISAEAVAYAQKAYRKDNLRYCQGSVEEIPIPGKKMIDVVVSYETIEHVDHDTQKRFLQEVSRILMDDGIFLVSTPNKLLYSDIPKYQNEFHKKEFYEQEFYDFLKSSFNHVSIYGQKICAGSNIWLLNSNGKTATCTEYAIENDGQRFVIGDDSKQSLYFIAVCSNKSIAAEKSSYLLDKTLSILAEKEKQILDLKRQAREKDALIANLQNEHRHCRETKERTPNSTAWCMGCDLTSDETSNHNERRNEAKYLPTARPESPHEGSPAAEAHEGILKLLVAAGKRTEAVFALERLVESFPDYAPGYNDLGVLYGESQDLPKALAAYGRAVSLDPANAIFRKNLADFLYVAMKRPEEAVLHYEKALELNPRDSESLLILGNLRVEAKDFSGARECYLKVLEIDPSNDLAWNMFDAVDALDGEAALPASGVLLREARLLHQRGQTDRAIRKLEGLLSVDPHDSAAHNDLGVLFHRQGDKAAALHHYEKAVELEPGNATYMKNLADFYLVEQGKTEEALHLYNRILAQHPSDIETLAAVGHVCIVLGRPEDALTFFERILNIDPDNGSARAILGQLCKAKDRQSAGDGSWSEIDVSIIFPVGNDPAAVPRCLGTVLQTTSGADYEIILSCGENLDGRGTTLVTGEGKEVRVVTVKETGHASVTLNAAARKATGRYLVFMDPRLLLSKGWLEPLLKVAENKALPGAIFPKVGIPPDTLLEAGFSTICNGSLKGNGERARIDDPRFNYVCETSHGSRFLVLTTRDAWARSGGFDEQIQDVGLALMDLSRSIRKRGGRLYYQPLSAVGFVEQSARHTGVVEPAAISSDVVNRLRPAVVEPAYHDRDDGIGNRKPSVLVVGVYLSDRPNTADDIVAVLSSSCLFDVVQRWVALGGPASTERLKSVTVRTVMDKTPKVITSGKAGGLIICEPLKAVDSGAT